MNRRPSAWALALFALPHISSAGPTSDDIAGSWICGPYEMTNPDLLVSAIDRPTYASDGGFTELGTATYTLPDGEQTRVETRHLGSWRLVGDIVEITFTSAEFLSSDNPILPVAAGQASLDAQMQRRNWSRKRVLSHGEHLVTVPVESANAQAEVRVSCSRA